MRYLPFAVFLSIFFGMMTYVFARGWQALPMPHRAVYAHFFILLLALLMLGLFFENMLPPTVTKAFTFAGFTFFISVAYLCLSFVLVDLVRLANYGLHFAPDGMHRFRTWAMGGSLVVIAVMLIVGNYRFNHPKIIHLDLSVEKPLQKKVLTIVGVSDIHLGNSIDAQRLRGYVQLINRQHPDLVLLAGDITDRSILPLMEQNMKNEFQAIHAPLGVYAVRGNHEYFSGKADEVSRYLKASGVQVLLDSVCLINNELYIIGRDDRTNTRRKPLSEMVKGLDRRLPMILIDHQPINLDEAQTNGIDLQFSGHTHDGQFFPGNLLVRVMYELHHGYLKKGSTHFYVSSGLGIWGPQYRIGTQSELVVIKLRY